MKIGIINGSQKPGASNTGIIVKELCSRVNKNHEIAHYAAGSKHLSPEVYKEITASDIIILAFPLYIDSIPSNMLKTLIGLEEYIKKEPAQTGIAYTIINNGFYEGKQTHIAFEIIRNWCGRVGIQFGGGIGQGAGEMLGMTINTPIKKGPFNNIGRELALLAEKIELKEPCGIKYLRPYFPKFLWRYMANRTFCHPLA
jgi:multimeric flavodoxin WrbA